MVSPVKPTHSCLSRGGIPEAQSATAPIVFRPEYDNSKGVAKIPVRRECEGHGMRACSSALPISIYDGEPQETQMAMADPIQEEENYLGELPLSEHAGLQRWQCTAQQLSSVMNLLDSLWPRSS